MADQNNSMTPGDPGAKVDKIDLDEIKTDKDA